MKKVQMLFLVLLFAFFLTGCVEVETDIHLKVNMDGSGSISLKVLLDQSAYGFLGKDAFADLEKQATQSGYQVEHLDTGQQRGMIATKEVDNIIAEFSQYQSDQASDSSVMKTSTNPVNFRPVNTNGENLFDELLKSMDVTVNEDSSLFLTKLHFHVLLGEKGQNGDMDFLADQMKTRLLVTLPIEASHHNADQIIEEDNTYIWNLRPGEKKPIQLSVGIPSIVYPGEPSHWIAWISVLIGIIALVVFGIWFFIRKRSSKPPAPPTSHPVPPNQPIQTGNTFHWDDD